jgi:branched-chain amino acid transport system permease protein
VVFAATGVLVLAIRSGRYGRRLAALNDSPAACATLGLNGNWTKLAIFATAAAIAGVAGALYGGQQRIISPNDFFLFNSLTMLLLLLIGGRNTVTGAFLGAMFFATFPVIQDHLPSLSNVQFLFTGLGAITIGQNPNGIGGQLADLGESIRRARHRRRDAAPGVQPAAEPA